uniref:Globin family profile domain-containing protein n=1 Tax=Romanomermis culicivorax TaxID=13658 RepID=A0A915ISB0_ROMCU
MTFRAFVDRILDTITDGEIEILQTTFQDLLSTDMKKIGMDSFLVLMSHYPQYKQLWSQFRFIPDSSLINAPELQNFAQIYMGSLQCVITQFSDRQLIIETLERISKAHFNKKIKRYHIEHLLPCFLEIMERKNKGPLDNEVKKAWSNLFSIIASIVEQYK